MLSLRSPQSPVTHTKPRSRAIAVSRRAVMRIGLLLALAGLTAYSLTRSVALREAQAAYARNDDLTATRRAVDHLKRWPRSKEAARIAALALSRQNYAALAEPYYARAGQLSIEEMHVRAQGLMRCNMRPEALEAFQAILARKPDDVQALRLQAGVLLTMYRRSEALELATRLTQIKGGEIIGYSMTAFIQHLLEDSESAVAAYEHVLELDPELRETPIPRKQFWLELTRELLRQGRAAEASRYMRRALRENEDAEMLDVSGLAYQQEGAVDDAERAWRKAVQLDPTYAPCWLRLGLLALQANRLEEAREDFERAVALSPKYYSAVYNLGLTYRRMGRLEEANRLRDEAVRIRRMMPEQSGGMGAMPDGGPPP